MATKHTNSGFCNDVNTFLWMISNYEYCDNELLPMEVILDSAVEKLQHVSSSSLGMLIRDVWEGKVKPKTSRIDDIDTVTGYFNLRKRPINGLHKSNTTINELTHQTIEEITLLCADRPGWIIDSSFVNNKSIRLMRPLDPDRSKAVAIDGYRLTLEIKINMVPRPAITISTCGREVSFCNIIGKDTAEVSLRSIDEAICLLEYTTPCIGQTISSEDEYQFFKLEVADSRVVTVTSENLEQHKRLLSTSCLLLRFRGNACKCCSYTAKLFRNRSSKRKATTSSSTNQFPHKKCNLRFLDNVGLEKKISIQRKQINNDMKKESRVQETELVELVDEDSCDLMEIVKSSNIKDVPPNLKLLWEQQMQQLSKQSSNGYRWDPRIIRYVLDVYCKNPRALDAMREFLVLPSNRLIRYYKNAVSQEEGWNDEVISWCQKEAKRQNLKPEEYWGGLLMDEMKIQEDLQLTVKGGKHQLTGMVSLGGFYNSMKKIESQGDSRISIATHVLQFVFLSDGGFRFPIAHFPTEQCPASVLYLTFWEGVLKMRRAGFMIYFSLCDGGDANRQFFKMHFSNCNPCDLHFIGYNTMTENPMVFLMDCKHNFKKLRNNVEKSSAHGSARCLTVNGKNIFWSHWKEAYTWDQNSNSCHFHERLKEDHFMLTPSLRMRNNLAEDVLDKKMLLLMKAYRDHLNADGDESHRLDATITFLIHTSVMVELFSDKHAIFHTKDNRLLKLEGALRYFASWKLSTSAPKEFLSDKTWFDLQSMVFGFISLVKSKFARFPGTLIKPAIVNQDVVENHFSQLRGANGQNDNPTYQMVQGTQNSIIFGQTTISKKCNTGNTKNDSCAGLPKDKLFSRR